MKKYLSHKVVHAGKIESMPAASPNDDGISYIAYLEDNEILGLQHEGHRIYAAMNAPAVQPGDLGYLVKYEDDYLSWSPSEAFEDGYTEVPEDSTT